MTSQAPIKPTISPDAPYFAVPTEALVATNGYPASQIDIPQSKMFVIKKLLESYKAKTGPDAKVYDASQGDGGASLPGVPHALLDRANEILKKNGTMYGQPHGDLPFRKATAEQYWQFDSNIGYTPDNIAATDGGRDGLLKAYAAMTYLGTGRVGDVLLVSRVPWISYIWGPYSVGMNVLHAPGVEDDGWAYSEDGIAASVEYAAKHDRRIAGLVLTSPDNPTGRTLSMDRQIALAQKALDLGVPFVLFDWIYNQVTAGEPASINTVLGAFSPADREKLIFLDGITKSLGGSNLRNAHLVASSKVVAFVVSRASHGVLPNFYGQAVAQAAYEAGFRKAAEPIIAPTNESREVVRRFTAEKGYKAIIGDGGYYAFINIADAIARGGFGDSSKFNEYMAENFGVTVIAGSFFSEAGTNWVRFSYALPPEKTQKALERFDEAVKSV